ncbi:MAG: WD40 repeat domain-containing protein [Planctomycetaceae bacterium]|jgi:WD40 repeat protein|nr:WD40 repeat domain-containing protein [Planctomycetaceae bacterium]
MKKIILLFFFAFICQFQFTRLVVGADSAAVSLPKFDTNQIKSISTHKENINAVAISPNGKFVATSAADRFVVLSEIESGKELWRVQFRGVASSLAFTPDGKRLAVGCRDKNLIICDVNSGKESAKFDTFTKPITAIEVSPNGKYVAAGFDNGAVLICDIAAKKVHKELLGKVHTKPILDIAFSGKSDRVLVASLDASVSIWNVNDGKWLYSFKGHRGPVKSVSYDRKDEKIVSSSTDKSIIVWKPASNQKQDAKELILQRFTGHTAEVSFACFAPDGGTVYSASIDKTFAQWNLRDGKQVMRIDVGQVLNRAVFSPATAYNAVWASGKQAAVVKTEQLKFIAPTYQLPANRNTFSNLPVVSNPVARFNLSADQSGKGSKANLNLSVLKSFSLKEARSCFFVNPQYAVSAGAGGVGVVWNVETRRVEYLFSHGALFTAVAFSPNSTVIAVGSKDGSIILLEPSNGKILAMLKGHTAAITGLTFSQNGKRLASASEDRLVINWNMDTGQSIGVAIGHSEKVAGVAILPDMSKTITVSADKTIRVWASTNKFEIWNESTQPEKRSEFVSVVMDRGGAWFAAGCKNNTIEIWQTNEKKRLATLSGLSDVPVAMAIAPDGKYLVSGGKDGVLVVWNTKTWKAEKTFVQLPEQLEKNITESKKGWVRNLPQKIEYEPIISVSFSNDGKKIITSGGNNSYIWNGIN